MAAIKRKAGRPSTYSPEAAMPILERMYKGDSIRSICATPGMPDYDTVSRWRIRNEDFAIQYARARRAQVEARIEDAARWADEMPMMDVPDPDGGISRRIDPAGIQRNKLRCEQARWEASKLLRGPISAPLDYGDRIQQEVSGPNGGAIPVSISAVDLTDDQLASLIVDHNVTT